MTMNKKLQPRSDVAHLNVSRKNGGRGFTGCINSLKSEKKWPRLVSQKQY